MKILSKDGKEKGNIELPQQFREEVRSDIIKRVVESIQVNKRQPYGSKKTAGTRASVEISKQRHDYRGCYGHGISRIPRKIMSRTGIRMNWVGAFSPGAVGGRRAHPPKVEKILERYVNDKERKKAIRSALAACVNKSLVKERGHLIPESYPFVIESDFERIEKTKDVKEALEKLGFSDELIRVEKNKIRSGRGKLRGRKNRSKKGPLIVVGKKCKLLEAANNIPGVEVQIINNVNCELLAPGSVVGRLTLFTEDSIKELKEKKLFI